MSERSFRFKPIETRYKGYRFRSRLEARWAKFLDELGIEYQYEPEGYALGGIPYLPDFWLPGEKCFFEVKGEDPTEDEIEKARRLALYTQRLVYIASGSISLPPNDLSHNITLITPPTLTKIKRLYNKNGRIVQTDYQYPDISTEVALLLQKLYEAKILASAEGNALTLLQHNAWWEPTGDLQTFIQQIRQQADILESIAPLLEKHQQDLKNALVTEDGVENRFEEQQVLEEVSEWEQCTSCGEAGLSAAEGSPHQDCPNTENPGKWNRETPRLIAAYTAAREARF